MANYSTYHAMGQGEPFDSNDPSKPPRQTSVQYQQPNPGQPYPQPGYGTPQQQLYGGTSPMSAPTPNQGYFGVPSAGQPPPPQEAGSLATQMGSMNLGGEISHHGKKKKKDRHAFHTVEAQGSSQAFNGIPQQETLATQFLNAPGSALGTTPIDQSPSQFPAPVNPQFVPGVPASSMEFAARQADSVPGPAAFVPAGGQGRVNPNDLPSIPISRDAVQPHYLKQVYPTFERHVPPPASVSFIAFDQSNASPKFSRMTLNNIPSTAEGLSSTALPLGLLLQPLAPVQPGELPVPVLDFGETGPPRCRRCRAYINPFMLFRSGGNKFVCNLCTYPNDTPSEYFCATTPQGMRVDRDQRPELCRGTVEFVVPKEYWTKPPVGIRWLFLIDVTQEAVNKGFLQAFCKGILSALYDVNSDDNDESEEEHRAIPKGAKVGFVTFDKDIHFYNVNVSIVICSIEVVSR